MTYQIIVNIATVLFLVKEVSWYEIPESLHLSKKSLSRTLNIIDQIILRETNE